MKTTIITLSFALFASLGATAQTDGTMPQQGKGDTHSCIMAGNDVWTTLGLSTEQIGKVKEIQASCQKAYDAAKVDGTAAVSVAKHEEELKTVLSPEQYKKWAQWCDEQRASKDLDKKAPTTPAN